MSVPRGHPGAGKHPRDNDRHRNASVFAAGLRKFDPVSNSCCGRVRNALGALANGEGVGVRSSTRCQPRGPFPSPTEVRELTPPPVSPLCPPHGKDPLGRPRKGRGALREAVPAQHGGRSPRHPSPPQRPCVWVLASRGFALPLGLFLSAGDTGPQSVFLRETRETRLNVLSARGPQQAAPSHLLRREWRFQAPSGGSNA